MKSPHDIFGQSATPCHPGQSRGLIEGVAFLGSFPPRQCGIATFTHDVCEHYAQRFSDRDCIALAMTDPDSGYDYSDRVAWEIRQASREDYRQAAQYVNGLKPSVISLQHEFGIFGGEHGDYLIDFLSHCEIPIVTTMHTVLANPLDSQRRVTQEIIDASSGIVVMAEKARALLQEHYDADGTRIHVVAHGIPEVAFPSTDPSKRRLGLQGRTVVLTFGLIGPGKGLEHGIRAMRSVADKHPDALYLILGATHPNLVKYEGEHYRESLQELVRSLGLQDNVRFVDKYVELDELTTYLGAADIYLTPYPNEAQITSGTLAYASGCGCPVVSTPFWHACELITPERGLLTPFQDVEALAQNVSALIGDPQRRQSMREAAVAAGRENYWPEIARQYDDVFAAALDREHSQIALQVAPAKPAGKPRREPLLQRLDHLGRMTDDTGIWQHATFNTPNRAHGYCLDDNARALLLSGYLQMTHQGAQLPWTEDFNPYFAFVERAFNTELGRFRNFMSAEGQWLEDAGSEDSQARALWCMGELLELGAFPALEQPLRQLFEVAMPAARSLRGPRSWAFALLGLNGYLARFGDDNHAADRLRLELKDRLAHQFRENGTGRWPWPEETLTYANAKIPHALLAAAKACDDELAIGLALNSLEWLMEVQTAPSGVFHPVGNRGWHSCAQGGGPAPFDQQPIEAHASLSACLAAWKLTGQDSWFHLAENTYQWFLGANALGMPLYDPSNGGCCDGLEQTGVNENQGAESLLAYHLSFVELERARRSFFTDRSSSTSLASAARQTPPRLKNALAFFLS